MTKPTGKRRHVVEVDTLVSHASNMKRLRKWKTEYPTRAQELDVYESLASHGPGTHMLGIRQTTRALGFSHSRQLYSALEWLTANEFIDSQPEAELERWWVFPVPPLSSEVSVTFQGMQALWLAAAFTCRDPETIVRAAYPRLQDAGVLTVRTYIALVDLLCAGERKFHLSDVARLMGRGGARGVTRQLHHLRKRDLVIADYDRGEVKLDQLGFAAAPASSEEEFAAWYRQHTRQQLTLDDETARRRAEEEAEVALLRDFYLACHRARADRWGGPSASQWSGNKKEFMMSLRRLYANHGLVDAGHLILALVIGAQPIDVIERWGRTPITLEKSQAAILESCELNRSGWGNMMSVVDRLLGEAFRGKDLELERWRKTFEIPHSGELSLLRTGGDSLRELVFVGIEHARSAHGQPIRTLRWCLEEGCPGSNPPAAHDCIDNYVLESVGDLCYVYQEPLRGICLRYARRAWSLPQERRNGAMVDMVDGLFMRTIVRAHAQGWPIPETWIEEELCTPEFIADIEASSAKLRAQLESASPEE